MHPLFLLTVFWSVVFTLNVGPDWGKYGSAGEVAEVAGLVTVLQWCVAYLALRLLVPRLLDEGRVRQFCLVFVAVLFVAAECNVLASVLYLEPTYPDGYGQFYRTHLGDLTLLQRLGMSSMIKWIVFSKMPQMAFPAAILIAANYYRGRHRILELEEQKRSAELAALKNQINPHFIFNTLNNIYALAIAQSEQTAEAIAKLSGILDYVLYQCRDKVVSVSAELAMIEDYIALEQLRFGDRIQVTLTHDIAYPAQIAPLLLLTLIENAFKHGAHQELGRAVIDLELVTGPRDIRFVVCNSKPPAGSGKNAEAESIGLQNLQQQLRLLYPDRHQLDVQETADQFRVELTLTEDPG